MDLYNASLGQEQESPIELTLEQYEEAKEHLGNIIECAKAARRLAENDDFKLLVLDGYLSNEPHRLAELIASGRLNEKTIGDCSRQLVSIADFRNYMKNITSQGTMAEDEIKDLETARDETIKEEEAAAGE